MAKETTGLPADDLRGFIRDVAVRSFDQLALRYAASDNPEFERSRRGAAVARLARLWQEMSDIEKERFFDHVISAAEAAAIAAPAIIGIRKLRKERKKRREDAKRRTTGPAGKK